MEELGSNEKMSLEGKLIEVVINNFFTTHTSCFAMDDKKLKNELNKSLLANLKVFVSEIKIEKDYIIGKHKKGVKGEIYYINSDSSLKVVHFVFTEEVGS